MAEFLAQWEKIEEREQDLARLGQDRDKIYSALTQIQGNMRERGNTGKEGAMRAHYVDELEVTEKQLKELAGRESVLNGQIEQARLEIEKLLQALA